MHFDTSAAEEFWNIVAKGEIAHDEQFLLFLKRFRLHFIIILWLIEIFHVIVLMFQTGLLQAYCMWERVKAGRTKHNHCGLSSVWSIYLLIMFQTFPCNRIWNGNLYLLSSGRVSRNPVDWKILVLTSNCLGIYTVN